MAIVFGNLLGSRPDRMMADMPAVARPGTGPQLPHTVAAFPDSWDTVVVVVVGMAVGAGSPATTEAPKSDTGPRRLHFVPDTGPRDLRPRGTA